MKKKYIAPRMEQMTMDCELPLCTCSGVVGNGSDIDIDILFGGTDVGGILDPSAKTRFTFDNLLLLSAKPHIKSLNSFRIKS